MAYRFPLVVNNSTTVVGELQAGDALNLSLSGIYDGSNTGTNGQVLKATGSGTVVWGAVGDVFVNSTQTVTNKTFNTCIINALTNTITNIPNASLQNSFITVNGTNVSLGSLVTTPDTNTTYVLTSFTPATANTVTVKLSAGGSGGTDSSYDITGSKINVFKNGTGAIELSPNLNTLTFGTYLTGTSYNPGTADVTIGLNASSTDNTGNTVVVRNAGDFTGKTITATTFSGSLQNTLTLNTSGTGVSGSTTYNNSGAATFTVTSNATSSGTTAGTIVSRGTNGDFTAGNITATSFVKSGGTASEFLKANGTVDTTAYLTFAAGTTLLFYQASAPTGWTQVTTQNNKALRVVSGTGGGTGGTSSFTAVFASRSVPLPNHTHSGSTGNQSADHSHSGSGTTGGQSSNHTHTGSGTTGTDSPDHSHSEQGVEMSQETQGGSQNRARRGVGQQTGGASTRHTHGFSFTTAGVSNDHSHGYSFNTGGQSANHNHSFTTGGVTYGGTIGNTMDFAVQYIDVIICSKN
jgi:hypothetical protein